LLKKGREEGFLKLALLHSAVYHVDIGIGIGIGLPWLAYVHQHQNALQVVWSNGNRKETLAGMILLFFWFET
jgi:hypothetical protein